MKKILIVLFISFFNESINALRNSIVKNNIYFNKKNNIFSILENNGLLNINIRCIIPLTTPSKKKHILSGEDEKLKEIIDFKNSKEYKELEKQDENLNLLLIRSIEIYLSEEKDLDSFEKILISFIKEDIYKFKVLLNDQFYLPINLEIETRSILLNNFLNKQTKNISEIIKIIIENEKLHEKIDNDYTNFLKEEFVFKVQNELGEKIEEHYLLSNDNNNDKEKKFLYFFNIYINNNNICNLDIFKKNLLNNNELEKFYNFAILFKDIKDMKKQKQIEEQGKFNKKYPFLSAKNKLKKFNF